MAQNDDIVYAVQLESLITLDVTAGTTYHIAVDGFASGDGNIVLNYDLYTIPVANDDTGIIDEDTVLNVNAASGLLANDTDLDGDTLTVDTADSTSANGATVTVNPDGSYVYDPRTSQAIQALAAGESLSDTFAYTVSDSFGAEDTATVSIEVTGVNDAPIANDDTRTVNENTVLTVDAASGVLANDVDIDGDTLTVISADWVSANGAMITFNSDGSYSYDPTALEAVQALAAGESLSDTFAYTVADSFGAEDTATVSIEVTGVNDAPILVSEISDRIINDATPFHLDISDNFDDIDNNDVLSFSAAGLPQGLSIDSNTGVVSGTAQSGNYDVTITAEDLAGEFASDTFALTVRELTVGTRFNDTLEGNSLPNEVYGLAGNDLITGKGDDDYLDGGEGNDTIRGNQGNDQIFGGKNNDSLSGNSGDDRLFGAEGNDTIYGGNNNDTIYGGKDNDSLDGGRGNDSLDGAEGNDTIYGGADNDTIYGGKDNDSLDGGRGNDSLDGAEGNDSLNGSRGNDSLSGGKDNDTISGGIGNDLLSGDQGNDRLDGNDGMDTLYGGQNNDTISGGIGNDLLSGDQGNDRLDGNDGMDTLYGGQNNDSLSGGNGNDKLFGGEDNDTLLGGAGDDYLSGGKGNDQLYGNEGADTFVLQSVLGQDTIFDFKLGEDMLVLDENFMGTVSLREQGSNTMIYEGHNAIAFLQGVSDVTLEDLGLAQHNVAV